MVGMIDYDEHQAALRKLRDELASVKQELKYAREAANSQRRRFDALHEARKGWGAATAESAEQYAHRVTAIAAALDAFVAAGTVYTIPDPPQPHREPAAPFPPSGERLDPRTHNRDTAEGLANLAETVQQNFHRLHWTPTVVAAAVAWVQRAHLNNLAGPENWRTWADDHDIDLINAVLNYLGKPDLERKDST